MGASVIAEEAKHNFYSKLQCRLHHESSYLFAHVTSPHGCLLFDTCPWEFSVVSIALGFPWCSSAILPQTCPPCSLSLVVTLVWSWINTYEIEIDAKICSKMVRVYRRKYHRTETKPWKVNSGYIPVYLALEMAKEVDSVEASFTWVWPSANDFLVERAALAGYCAIECQDTESQCGANLLLL